MKMDCTIYGPPRDGDPSSREIREAADRLLHQFNEAKKEDAMITRCKFICQEVTKSKAWGEFPFVYRAKFSVVTSGSEENAKFFASTPSGQIDIATIRADHFEVGAAYYFDIEKAEA